MKILKVKGFSFLLDSDDYMFVSRFSWCLHGKAPTLYLMNRQLGLLHRFIMGYPKKCVDHKNRNTLDNRKRNLRICTHSENIRNRRPQNGRKFKGILWRKGRLYWKYQAYIRNKDKKQEYLGTFSDIEDAARAYNKAAKKYFGEFACLNEI